MQLAGRFHRINRAVVEGRRAAQKYLIIVKRICGFSQEQAGSGGRWLQGLAGEGGNPVAGIEAIFHHFGAAQHAHGILNLAVLSTVDGRREAIISPRRIESPIGTNRLQFQVGVAVVLAFGIEGVVHRETAPEQTVSLSEVEFVAVFIIGRFGEIHPLLGIFE